MTTYFDIFYSSFDFRFTTLPDKDQQLPDQNDRNNIPAPRVKKKANTVLYPSTPKPKFQKNLWPKLCTNPDNVITPYFEITFVV